MFYDNDDDLKFLHLFPTFEIIFHLADSKRNQDMFQKALQKRSKIIKCDLREKFRRPLVEKCLDKMIEVHKQLGLKNMVYFFSLCQY